LDGVVCVGIGGLGDEGYYGWGGEAETSEG